MKAQEYLDLLCKVFNSEMGRVEELLRLAREWLVVIRKYPSSSPAAGLSSEQYIAIAEEHFCEACRIAREVNSNWDDALADARAALGGPHATKALSALAAAQAGERVLKSPGSIDSLRYAVMEKVKLITHTAIYSM